jgi:hypothetical protein
VQEKHMAQTQKESGQLLLDLGFEPEQPVPRPDPPFIQEPKNDNDRLLNLQYRYLTGNDKAALSELYVQSCRVSHRMIMNQRDKKGFFLTEEDAEEKAHNAATYLITQYLTRPDFVRTKNIVSYLFARIRHELYYQTKVDSLTDYVDFSDNREL